MSFSLSPSLLHDPAVLQMPALLPPPGVKPNFAHPQDRGSMLIFVNGFLSALMLIFIGIRAYTKTAIARKYSWDDLTILLSAFSACVLYILFVWETKNGPLGTHQWDIHLGDLLTNTFFVPEYVFSVVTSPTLWSTKFTFFLLYLQIFWPMRWLRIAVYIGATLTTTFYVGVTVAQIVLVTPEPGQGWVLTFLSHREVRLAETAIPVASVGLVVDLFLLIIPSIAVCQLQLHISRKLGLMLMFSTGFAAVVASAMSIYVRYVDSSSEDHTWTLLNVVIVYLVEIEVGVITASMPSFALMLRHHLPALKELRSRVTSQRKALLSSNDCWPRSTLPRQSEISRPRTCRHGAPGNSKSGFAASNPSELEKALGTTPQSFEMDGPSSVKTFIEGGRCENVEKNAIYLRHDVEHTWSPVNGSHINFSYLG